MTLKCPFAAPITAGVAVCRNAQEVVRRGGSEYDCRSPSDQAACLGLFQRLKAAALPAFGLEDDLLAMPHSTLVKIQSGGLLGLDRILGGTGRSQGPGEGTTGDIADLVARAQAHFGDLDLIPYADLAGDILGYRLPKRGTARCP